MASQKKESIALLSIYGDEDDEMEDLEEAEHQRDEEDDAEEERPSVLPEDDTLPSTFEYTSTTVTTTIVEEDSRIFTSDSTAYSTPPVVEDSSNPRVSATTTPLLSITSPQQQLQQQAVAAEINLYRSVKTRLTIVDYAHDEVAMSPEAEEGEIVASGRVMYGEELEIVDLQGRASPGMVQVLTPSTQATPPQPYEPSDRPDSDMISSALNESGSAEAEEVIMATAEEPQEIDPLDKFLPPPPKIKCSDELQEKIIKFLSVKKTSGRSYNAEVRNRKEYRNPDFLLHAVTYQDIDQIGSCFSKDVFDPHGYDKSDFYDEIEADMRREMERREQEKKKNQKLDFVSGATQPGTVPTPKLNLPIPGIGPVGSGGLSKVPVVLDALPRDGRQTKKSKWDKVDTDPRDSVSSIGAHAAILSAANAGTGYTAFAQQRRREAEDKRSADKKLDRRS